MPGARRPASPAPEISTVPTAIALSFIFLHSMLLRIQREAITQIGAALLIRFENLDAPQAAGLAGAFVGGIHDDGDVVSMPGEPGLGIRVLGFETRA